MALVRMNRTPVAFNNSIFSDFDRLFGELAKSNSSFSEAFNYPADLYETDDHVVLEMSVPGLKAENLDISVEDHVLTIKGSFKEEAKEEDKDRRYWMQSLSRRDFSRSLKLPRTVDVDTIEANVEDGILKLRMPKIAEAKV
ncbi:MAG: Hsp20/alpha crystallin family protein, partial [Trueperaceae bacterium]|nr:Hsp20/alpha crystallin family protein [Trueperaceae bacterium]